jgi:Xaa-Pro dipeptidase
MNVDYNARQAKLRDISSADAVAVVPGPNMVYFTGLHFHLSERPVIALFTPDGNLSVIIPELEIPKLDARPDLEARAFGWKDKDGYVGAFEDAIRELGLRGKVLGIDGMTMRATEWFTFQSVDSSLRVNMIENELTRIRAHKTRDEIEAMRAACRLSEAALDKLLAWVEPGKTEKAIAARLGEELSAQGSHGNSFEPLVQTGPNSALPHGFTSQRALQADEFMLIDFGGSYNGYPADITRTFCLGLPSDEMQKIYDTVLRANEAARAIAGPGIPMGAVDKAARDVISEAGYGDYFIHRTGHGLGLDVHEPIPQIASGVEDLLEPCMTFTIEPGIYIPGLGGVRVEDNVAVTEDGLDVLTSYPRRLRVG